MNLRRFLFLFCLWIVSVSLYAGNLDGYLIILHTNDIHGRCIAGENCWGYAGIKSAKESLAERGAEVILADAGDFSQGTSAVNFSRGASAVEYMNKAGYDAAALGNHEFDWGFENIYSVLKKADFSVISANIMREKESESIFKPNCIFTLKNGQKIGFFGLETPSCATGVHPDKIKGLKFAGYKEMYEIAQKQTDILKENKCSLVVCLGHLGIDELTEPNTSYDLIKNTCGIDLFIDGHSHSVLKNGMNVNSTLLVSSGCHGEYLGYVVYRETEKGPEYVKCGLADPKCKEFPFEGSAGTDKELADLILSDQKKMEEKYSRPIGETQIFLNGERDPGNRTEETNFGDLITDAFLWKTGADCAIINGGGIRSSLNTGKISMLDLKTVFPFGNELVVLKAKGSEILEALEASMCVTPAAIGGFPQISGIETVLDTNIQYEKGEMYPDTTVYAPKKPGSRVTIKKIGGKDFDPNAFYTVATVDFVGAGGDTYYAFKYPYKNAGYSLGIMTEEVLAEYIEKKLGGKIGKEYEVPQGRLTILK